MSPEFNVMGAIDIVGNTRNLPPEPLANKVPENYRALVHMFLGGGMDRCRNRLGAPQTPWDPQRTALPRSPMGDKQGASNTQRPRRDIKAKAQIWGL